MRRVQEKCQHGEIKSFLAGGRRLIPESEVDRVLHSDQPAQAGATINGNEGTVVGKPSRDLATPEELLRERGLDPEEWTVTHLKVNEWDALSGEGEVVTMKQLTVNVRRKLQLSLFQEAFVSDDYVAPKKVKSQTEGAKLVVFVGDQQAPFQDQRLHEVFCNWLEENAPDEGVLMGDTLDLPDVSRYTANPEWDQSVQQCINAGYLLLRDYVQASTNTKWIKLIGNHEERIRARLLNQIAALYGVRPADIPGEGESAPALCISNLLRLEQLGIDYIDPDGGYSHAQHKVSRHLAARHGWIARKGSGASALTTLEHLGYSVVVGHTHRQGLVHKTTHDIDGTLSTLAAAETGCMCKIKDGLGYTVAPDWQNGFATAMVWPDGTFRLELATFANDRLYWRDQRYG